MHIHWKDWCWSWNSNSLATWCEELTHWERPGCREILKMGGEGDDRGWDGWMASLTQWTWVWVNSGIWRWTGRPGVLQSMGSQRVGHSWATELNWTPMFIAALFTIDRTWKQARCPSAGEWIKKLCYVYTMEYCCCWVAKSCLPLCDPMDCNTSVSPVLYYLQESAHTHSHWVSDVIQPSHPLLLPSPPALNIFQQ